MHGVPLVVSSNDDAEMVIAFELAALALATTNKVLRTHANFAVTDFMISPFCDFDFVKIANS
jgi:hypothetical protein